MNYIHKIKKLIKFLLGYNSHKIEYKLGNKKFHNSLVDSMFPEFVEIGDNFTSGPGSIILAHDASLYFHNGTYRVEKTTIGDNVFLGANATVLPGVKIGDGAIIGAGSVVAKDVEPFSVVAGIPAKFISTVDEYIAKCENREVLIKAPESFEKFYRNEKLTTEDIKSIRLIALQTLS